MIEKEMLENLTKDELEGALGELGFELIDKRPVTGGRYRNYTANAADENNLSEAPKFKVKGRSNLLNSIKFENYNEVTAGYYWYAIAARNGYGLYNSASTCSNQLNYFKEAEWKGFEYADDAMAWIIDTVPGKSHIRGHEFCSLDYMLKHSNYWFSKGKEE